MVPGVEGPVPGAGEPGAAPPPGGRTQWGRGLGNAALIVAGATLGSKVLGFLRDTVLADRFGAGGITDAYIAASFIPLALFAAVGVAIQTVFIPVLASVLAREGKAEAEEFTAHLNAAVSVLVALLVALLEVAAGPAVSLMGHGLDRAGHVAAVRMVRIMAPLILFYAWSGIVGGALNVRGYFGPNAAMGIPQNLIIIGAIIAGTLGGGRDIYLVAWGGLVGTATTYLVQLPALRRSGFRVGWRLAPRDPRLLRMVRLVVPAALTAVAQQFALGVDRALGSGLRPAGLLTDLTYAGRLQLLAYSVLGLSIATVLLPRLAAAAARRDMATFRETFLRGLGLVNFVMLPVVAGLFLLRTPVVSVVFEHGAFAPRDVPATAYALAFLSLGTVGYGWQDYLNRTFFALQDTRSPLIGGLIAVGVTVVLDFSLVGPLRQGGLALGTAAGWTCAATFLALRLRRRMGLLGGRALASGTLRQAVAAGAGFIPAALLYAPVARALGGGRWSGDTLGLLLVVGGALAIYGAVCALLRVRELGAAASLLRGLGGRRAVPGA